MQRGQKKSENGDNNCWFRAVDKWTSHVCSWLFVCAAGNFPLWSAKTLFYDLVMLNETSKKFKVLCFYNLMEKQIKSIERNGKKWKRWMKITHVIEFIRIRPAFHDGLRVNYVFDRRKFPLQMTAFFEHSRSSEDFVLYCAVKNIIRWIIHKYYCLIVKYGKLNSSLRCKEVIKNAGVLNINSKLENRA